MSMTELNPTTRLAGLIEHRNRLVLRQCVELDQIIERINTLYDRCYDAIYINEGGAKAISLHPLSSIRDTGAAITGSFRSALVSWLK